MLSNYYVTAKRNWGWSGQNILHTKIQEKLDECIFPPKLFFCVGGGGVRRPIFLLVGLNNVTSQKQFYALFLIKLKEIF